VLCEGWRVCCDEWRQVACFARGRKSTWDAERVARGEKVCRAREGCCEGSERVCRVRDGGTRCAVRGRQGVLTCTHLQYLQSKGSRKVRSL
jgi:hypothetical protein